MHVGNALGVGRQHFKSGELVEESGRIQVAVGGAAGAEFCILCAIVSSGNCRAKA